MTERVSGSSCKVTTERVPGSSCKVTTERVSGSSCKVTTERYLAHHVRSRRKGYLVTLFSAASDVGCHSKPCSPPFQSVSAMVFGAHRCHTKREKAGEKAIKLVSGSGRSWPNRCTGTVRLSQSSALCRPGRAAVTARQETTRALAVLAELSFWHRHTISPSLSHTLSLSLTLAGTAVRSAAASA